MIEVLVSGKPSELQK